MIRVSDLRKRVTIQKPVTVADAMGAKTTTWTDVVNVWAAIWPISASETVRQGQQAMLGTYRIRLRYYSSLAADWRIKHGTTYYSINGIVNPSMKNEMLDLICKEAEVE